MQSLAALFMSASAAIADPLLRRAFGWPACPSDPHRTARVRIGALGLRAPISRRGSAISRRTVMNNAGYGRRMSQSSWASNRLLKNWCEPLCCDSLEILNGQEKVEKLSD